MMLYAVMMKYLVPNACMQLSSVASAVPWMQRTFAVPCRVRVHVMRYRQASGPPASSPAALFPHIFLIDRGLNSAACSNAHSLQHAEHRHCRSVASTTWPG